MGARAQHPCKNSLIMGLDLLNSAFAIRGDACLFNQISIVLVNTTHPGNIGAVARAMKNMGLGNLVLVSPKAFPHAEATARAAGADELLERAVVVDNLKEAVAECHFVVGTSARQRTVAWPLSNPRECVAKILPMLQAGQRVAVVFGNEQSGLSNTELSLCHYHLHIPCDENFSSLNVAAAVQIVTYELRMMFDQQSAAFKILDTNSEQALAAVGGMEEFYTRLEEMMVKVGYLQLGNPGKLMLRLRRLFNRAIVEESEIHILRGMLNAFDAHIVDEATLKKLAEEKN
jgi:tRNA (cytidine32/uridine32-2'-O)-methyltransferase